MTVRIGIVVVHWRGMQELLECLQSLAPVGAGGPPVLVAVNAGGDFDEGAARAACPGVDIVRSERNGGYAAGCNLGWRALDTRVDAVLFLNNDVVVDAGIARQVAAAFSEDARLGVVGPPVVYYDEPARVWALGGRVARALGYTRQIGLNTETLPSQRIEVDYVNGSAIAVRGEVLRQAGGWDETYFHFFDEVDLCARARVAGWGVACVPIAPVRHKVSATTGNRGSARFTKAQARYFGRNRVRFFARNGRGWQRVTALALQLPWTTYEAVKALLAGSPAEGQGRIAGLIDGARWRSGERTGAW